MIRKRILRAATVLGGFAALMLLPATTSAQSGGFAIGGGLGGYSAGKSGGGYKAGGRSGYKSGRKFGGKRFGAKRSFGRKFVKRKSFGSKSKFARFKQRGRHAHRRNKRGFGIGWGYPFAAPAVIYASDRGIYVAPPAPAPIPVADWKLYRVGTDGGCQSEDVKVGGGATVTVIRC